MGSDMLSAAILTTTDTISTPSNLTDIITELAHNLTYGHLYTAADAQLSFAEDILEDHPANDHDPDPSARTIAPAIAEKITSEVGAIIGDLKNAVHYRSVNSHSLPDGSVLWITGGESWGDTPAECDLFWDFANLDTLFGRALFDLISAWPVHAAPLILTHLTADQVTHAATTCPDPEIRRVATSDPLLPISGEQVEVLAHDDDHLVREAAAERVRAALGTK